MISGDRPETVAAVAADAGIDVGEPIDGRELPRDLHALRRLVEEHGVIGRIAPEEKKRVIEALAADGRHVAMVGDGVNDVPALKAADLAIAQGTGSQMARSVSDLVLVRGDFAASPRSSPKVERSCATCSASRSSSSRSLRSRCSLSSRSA